MALEYDSLTLKYGMLYLHIVLDCAERAELLLFLVVVDSRNSDDYANSTEDGNTLHHS
jgi:hypothetical protein